MIFFQRRSFNVNMTTGKCTEEELMTPFRPITSGDHSRFIGEEIIGAAPGDGVLISTYEEHRNDTKFEGKLDCKNINIYHEISPQKFCSHSNLTPYSAHVAASAQVH